MIIINAKRFADETLYLVEQENCHYAVYIEVDNDTHSGRLFPYNNKYTKKNAWEKSRAYFSKLREKLMEHN